MVKYRIPVVPYEWTEDDAGPPNRPPYETCIPDTKLTALAAKLWDTYFERIVSSPIVYWTNMERGIEAQGSTFRRGIVVQKKTYLSVKGSKRRRWLLDLIKHELLHWAGYGHGPVFLKYIKFMGGDY